MPSQADERGSRSGARRRAVGSPRSPAERSSARWCSDPRQHHVAVVQLAEHVLEVACAAPRRLGRRGRSRTRSPRARSAAASPRSACRAGHRPALRLRGRRGANERSSSSRTRTIRAAFSARVAAGSSFLTGRAFILAPVPVGVGGTRARAPGVARASGDDGVPALRLRADQLPQLHVERLEAVGERRQPRRELGVVGACRCSSRRRSRGSRSRRGRAAASSAAKPSSVGDRDVAVAALAERVGELLDLARGRP